MLRSISLALAGALVSAAAAAAEPAFTLPPPPFTLPFLPSPLGDWTVTIGVGGEARPSFEGSKNFLLSPVPIFSIRRAGTAERFRSPRDGISFGLIEFGGFRAGPVGKFVRERNADSYAALHGLGDVKFAVEIGGFAEYFPVEWFRTRIEVRRGFGGHEGIVADFSADLIAPSWHGFTLSGGPRFSLGDTRSVQPYYSINAAQALASGLPSFDAKGGARSVGAGALLRYRINPQWTVHSYVEYSRLLGSAASSPLVRLRGSTDQVTFGFGASYSFDVRVR
ncbi:MipA/OmpV family protein [Phreatobacter stygius]|uniref:MipA/OmpV family protein n=1 Tax=Phreatobacter stygius TaxID=1940610 RepID=A0A4D7BAY1_9HYPH|nr:MipA/OmpV family protein [Phreatobacter stygius]QCI67288.1 MipA/OmpV family protein [Phreatobacter stygius]